MVNSAEILSLVDASIKSSPPAPSRSNSAESLRLILKQLVQWVVQNDYTPDYEMDGGGTKLRFKKADGTPGVWVDLVGIRGVWRGDWLPTTVYAAGDGVTYGGNSYRRKTAGTSGVTFNLPDWDLIAQGGSVADFSITTNKLADGSTNTQKIASRAVTADKTDFTSQTSALEDSVFDHIFSITDESGNFLMKVSQDLVAYWKAMALSQLSIGAFRFDLVGSDLVLKAGTKEAIRITANGTVMVTNLTITPDLDDPWPSVVADENGWIAQGIDRSGVNIQPDPALGTEVGLQADIIHIIVYGQSLSVAGNTGSALTVAQRVGFNSLMFVGGPVTWENQTDSAAIVHGSLVSLLENMNRESPCSGVSESFLERLQAENGLAPSNDYRLLLSAPGKSGQTLAQLSKGTTNYANLLSDITYGLALANAQNKTYNMPAVVILQGEQDAANGQWAGQLAQFAKDINTDVKGITGQTNDVRIIIYQTASFNAITSSVSIPTVAFEQYDVATSPRYKNIYMGGPMYHLTYRPDYIHLTPTSSKLAGAMLAVALKRVIYDGQNFKPIHVLSATRQGNLISARMYVPVKPLVLDTATISDPGNYGFRVVDAYGTVIPITSVTLVRGDTIRIQCSTAIPAGSFLTYAAQMGTAGQSGPAGGQRGCLRDSQNIVFDPTGLNQPIRNWCPIFRVSIK